MQACAGDAEGDAFHLLHVACDHLVVADEVLAEGAHGVWEMFAFHLIILGLAPEFTLNLNQLTPGMYMLEINGNNRTSRAKIIISK